jgi:hypothetical protein
MLKFTVAVLAVVLASSASAAGWRKLRIDASSDTSFQESVALFQDKLSPSRRVAFAMSLEDIWLAGSRLAEEQQREYTQADYLRQLDGLGYEEVVTLMDPTGKNEGRYRAVYYQARPRPFPETDPRIALRTVPFPTGPIVSRDQYIRSKSRWCTLRPSC